METINIVELLDRPEFIPIVVRWIRDEWPDSRDDQAIEERLCGSRQRGTLPMALVAIAGSTPVGFVSLTLYEKGIERGQPHWIDALYVEPTHRGQGLGRRLLQAAEETAPLLRIRTLFALTEIPRLYHKCGWRIAEEFITSTGRDYIVTKELAEKE
ncbi:MAG: GNAT family N-acetyltransferase [Pirellulaceae bacterium]